MSLIQTPWTSQPQQAGAIDWSNPITRGIISVQDGRSGRDVVGGIFGTLSNASSIYSAATGLGVGTNYNQNQIDFPLSKVAGSSTAGSILFVGELSSGTWNVATVNNGMVVRKYSGGFTIALGGSGSVYNVSAWSGVGAVVGIVWNDALARPMCFLNGKDVGTRTSTNTDGSNWYLDSTLGGSRVGDRGAATYWAKPALLSVRWNRNITPQEAASLSQNPWQIFKPLPRRIFVPVSAATGDATGTGSLYAVTLSFPTGTASGTGASNGTGTGSLAASSLSSPSATATGSALATGSFSAVSTAAPSATATGSALATGALTTVTLTTITASATGSALATGSLDAIDLSTVSGTATGTTAGNAEGVGSVATIALSAPTASAVGSALATGSFAHVSLSAVSGTASAATNGQATADLQPISISAPLAIAIASSVATGGIQSIGLTAPNASASGQAQTIARPGSDTSNSGWTPSTGSDLYAMLDEVSPNDADYISTASAGAVCRLGLGAVADPGTSSGQVVSYRASSSTGNGLKVELMQGGTVIATWNHATLPATDTTYQQSLSAAECDAITDYTALSVRLTSL